MTNASQLGSKPARAGLRLAAAAAGIVLLWLAVRVVFFEGFHGSDDFSHARFAFLWHRPPGDHWESRLPYNALMRASFVVLGFSEVAAAVPGMIGSALTLGAGLWLVWHRRRSLRMFVLAGVLFAFLPSDVLLATTAAATKILATGLLTLGAAVLLCRRGWWWGLLAGAAFGVAVTTHLSVMFFAGLFLLSAVLLERSRLWTCVWALAGAAAVALALNVGVFYLWTGDPLHRFHIIVGTHFAILDVDVNARPPLTESGALSVWFLWRPIQDLIVSKYFTLWAGAALIGALATWRRRSPACRLLALASLLTWLWMSYGTQTPTRYEPFPGTTSYWQPLNMLIVIILAELLCAIRWRRAAAAAAALPCLMALGVLGMSGPWGQNVEISRALMAYAKQRPARHFVTDDRTLTQMYVLNGFEPVGNVHAYPDSAGNRFFRATTMPAEPAEMLVLVNPLNDMAKNPSFRWLEARCGREVHSGRVRYRMLTYLLPRSFRRAHAWTVRRPALRVCEFRESR
jgi:hypothetical protein